MMPQTNPNSLANLRPFKKNDPRINRNGRPAYFQELRALAQHVGNEKIVSKDPNDGSKKIAMSRIEMMLRVMASSGDPRLIIEFIHIAYGTEKTEIDITTNGQDINGANPITDEERTARIIALLDQAREARARLTAGGNGQSGSGDVDNG